MLSLDDDGITLGAISRDDALILLGRCAGRFSGLADNLEAAGAPGYQVARVRGYAQDCRHALGRRVVAAGGRKNGEWFDVRPTK
jgi:hypothetical protein